MWAELRKERTGQPEVDGLSLVDRPEDLEYFFPTVPTVPFVCVTAKHRRVKRKVFPETIVLGWPPFYFFLHIPGQKSRAKSCAVEA